MAIRVVVASGFFGGVQMVGCYTPLVYNFLADDMGTAKEASLAFTYLINADTIIPCDIMVL